MAVGFNTKSTKPYKKAFVLFYYDVLVPAHGLDLDQDHSQRCERTEVQVKREPILTIKKQIFPVIFLPSFNLPHSFLHWYHKKDSKYGVNIKNTYYQMSTPSFRNRRKPNFVWKWLNTV